jgi:[glutamine synthetase] adenylyltransferase / [glutamine synthetase]-adenylyl-L-tyrosine phosphorylase
VRMLGEDLTPRSSETLTAQMRATAERQADPGEAVRSIRAVRRRELFRIAVGELFGDIEVAEVGAALSRLTDATLEATLEVAGRSVRAQRGLDQAPTRIAIVAMGRYGGFELSYGSDADVMFVHEPDDDTDVDTTSYAQAVANEVRALLIAPASDPALVVDADLRPEGKQGPLVRTLASYAAYYAKWSKVWEAQALLRADAVVGDEQVREHFTTMIGPLRYPPEGISEADVVEVRRIKARVDRERLPRGADPQTHLKLGRGGLADIEWTVQLLQLRYAGRVPALRSPRTLTALAAAREAELLSAADADALDRAWRSVSRLRNAITLVTGKSGDQLPRDARERAAVASILDYGPGRSDEMVNDYLRTTRLARAVVDRIFWE